MHLTVLILLALAGIGFCLAAVQRWRSIAGSAWMSASRRLALANPGFSWLWSAFACLSAATVVAVLDDAEHRDLAYAALAVWAGIASLLFLGRWLAMPSRGLLALPVGAMVLMIATAGATTPGRPPTSTEPLPMIVLVHAGFMILHAGAMLVAGTAGGLYLITAWLLKNPSPKVMAFPNLRVLERLTERGLIIATGLLVGGLATGSAAMHQRHINFINPTTVLGLISMAFLIVILGLRLAHRLNRRSMGIASVTALALTAVAALSQVVLAHG